MLVQCKVECDAKSPVLCTCTAMVVGLKLALPAI